MENPKRHDNLTESRLSRRSPLLAALNTISSLGLFGVFLFGVLLIGIIALMSRDASLDGLLLAILLAVLSFVGGAVYLVHLLERRILRAPLKSLAAQAFSPGEGETASKTTPGPVAELLELPELIKSLLERHELLTANLAAAVVIRSSDGSTLFVSPYTEVLTGYTLEEVQDFEGDFMSSIVEKEDQQRYKRALMISELGEDIIVRYRIRHHSGMLLWVETHLVPVTDLDGELLSVMGVSIDVTSSVRYQQKIEEQNRDLSDFTYMVSHDLKAPIFTIKGMANLLAEDCATQLDEDAMDSLKHITDAAERLERLIKSVMEYSSVATKEIKEEHVELNDVLNQVQSDLSQQIAESGAQISVEENLPLVKGDSLRIYQVFSNLLGNAIKYREPSRAVEISVSLREQSEQNVALFVRDNGMGIPEDKIDDIFRPYHRAHGNEIEGSGIGLACVKKIVDRLGGSVSVQSTLGEGSIFTLVFRHAESGLPAPELERESTTHPFAA